MKTDRKKMLLADFALLLVALVWGGGFIAVKDGLNSMTPMLLTAYRFIIASGFVYVFFFKKMRSFTKHELVGGVVTGIALTIAFAFQTFGLKYIEASKQGFLTAIYVVIVPFLYWILYKKMPARKTFYASFIAIIGIALISLNGSLSLGLGEVLTLLCALFFAVQIIALDHYTEAGDPLKLAFLQLFVAGVLSAVVTVFTEPVRFALTSREWYVILYLSMFSTFLCFTLQTVAQKYTTSSHASILMSLESVFAALLGVWLLGEPMTIKIFVGCVLVFISILIIELNFKGGAHE